jgi:hypothetical protein
MALRTLTATFLLARVTCLRELDRRDERLDLLRRADVRQRRGVRAEE